MNADGVHRGAWLLAAALVLAGCGSSATDVADQGSLWSTRPAPSTTTTPVHASTEQTSATPVSATPTTVGGAGEGPATPCSIESEPHQLVDVRIDDGDGGLNVRSGPGIDNSILVALPRGSEVRPLDGCVVDSDGQQWWNVQLVTDESIAGWVSARYLEDRSEVTCPTGRADVSGLSRVSISSGDFDGDGIGDLLHLGNTADRALVQIELADGGFASAHLDMEEAGEVLAVLRPIGAPHDVIIFRDNYASGASTNYWTIVELVECTPVEHAEGFLEGGSVGWGHLGYCFEPTPFGVRFWFIGAVGDTEAEREANYSDTPWHHDGTDLVQVPGEPAPDRECAEYPTRNATTYLGATTSATDLIGLGAESLEALAQMLADTTGAASWSMPGEVEGFDASSGRVTIDVTGLADDSVSGLRLLIDFENILSPDGATIAGHNIIRAERTTLCSRGVTIDRLCI